MMFFCKAVNIIVNCNVYLIYMSMEAYDFAIIKTINGFIKHLASPLKSIINNQLPLVVEATYNVTKWVLYEVSCSSFNTLYVYLKFLNTINVHVCDSLTRKNISHDVFSSKLGRIHMQTHCRGKTSVNCKIENQSS